MLTQTPKETSLIFNAGSTIRGVDLRDEKALRDLTLNASKKNAIFVEVGSWKGHTASILGEIAKKGGGQVYCIDTWKGTFGEPTEAGEFAFGYPTDSFAVFQHNIEAFELTKVVTPLIMESATATTIFSDGIADMVFIDADHRYKGVKQDIELWWPKVKVGGILCGHDCEEYYSDLSPRLRKRIDETLDGDYSFDILLHSGVIKALHDCFGHKFFIKKGTRIWYKRKVL